MKRILVSSAIIVLVLIIPLTAREIDTSNRHYQQSPDEPSRSSLALADVGGTGEDAASTLFMSRTFSDKQLSILNSYNAPDHHNGTLNLTQNHIPGWTLYNVTMTLDNLTAAQEREVVGVTPQETEDFQIDEPVNNLYTTQLSQEFYNEPYNGSLQNYSIRYRTVSYDTQWYGYAFYTIRSDYTSSSTNLTNEANITASVPYTWTTIDGSNVNLTLNTKYYTIIDGTNLVEYLDVYPDIFWSSEDSAGTFNTSIYFSGWQDDRPNEALLNYTYIPWNQTSNTVLVFQPSEIEMRGNGTLLTGSSWSWTSSSNITQIDFDSNQSVYINHNLTLWYKKSVSTQTVWDVPDSGGVVNWNQTVSLDYPTIDTSNFVNLSRMQDWTATGLYNGTSTDNYNNYTTISTTVTCSNMTNGTWTMTFTAHNYLTGIDSLDSVSIVDDLSITALIKDGSSVNATDGSTNLTIWQDTTKVSNPFNVTVTNGATQYVWDIDLDTSNNGIYRIEVYWTNGTEAGYLTKQVVVYYPTELGATDYTIDAYTEDSFEVRVSYNDTFTPQGLDGSSSTVEYSFDGAANTTMTDHSNGTWTATILTIGKTFGTYYVDVYAEGFAIENQTLTVTVNLLHDTLPLVGAWSQPYEDNITYTQSTNLTILYQRVDGTNVTDAMVNVTIDGSTYDLHYDAINEFYWIQFNGSDSSGFSTFPLAIEAWKSGYVDRANSSLSLIVRKQPTTLTLTWTATTIDYLGQIDLTVEYWYGVTAVPATSPNVNITINGGTLIPLNQSGNYWTANLTGQYLDLGSHNIVVYAWEYGYVEQSGTEPLTVDNVTTNVLVIVWEPSNVTIDYTQLLNLTVDYTYDSSDVPSDAWVNVTINSHTYNLTFSTGLWRVSIPGNNLGIGVYDATISCWLYGYDTQSNVTTGVNITLAANSFVVEWSPSELNLTYVEIMLINVTYTKDYQPILGATVQLIVNNTRIYDFTYNATTEKYHFTISASTLGLGTWNTTMKANKTGYDTGTMSKMMLVRVDPCTATPNWFTTEIFYTHQTDLNVTLLDSLGQPMESTIVNATYSGVNYTLTHVANGVYRLRLNGSDGMGTYPIQILTFIYGFMNRTVDVQLDIVETPTDLYTSVTRVFEYSGAQGTILYNDGWLVFNVRYEDIDLIALLGATLNITIDGQVYALSIQPSGNYTLTLLASQLGIGAHSGSFLADIYGYETRNEPFSIDVEPVPAHIEVSLGVVPSVMFLNDSVIIRFDYINNHTGTGIDDASTTVFIWPNDLAVQSIGIGRFEVNISSFSLALTDHVLNITLGHVNYTTAQFVRVINVRPVNTRFTASSSFGQYENETVILAVNYTDIDHGQFIHWASVNATIEGTVFQMEYAGEGIYALSLHITWSPGTYQISFAASAVGCASNSTTAQLSVSEKVTVYLTLSVIGASEGQSAQISAILRENNTENPIQGITIYYEITIVFTNGTVLVDEEVYAFPTNDEGEASFAYLIPAGVDYLEIAARFDGTTSIWGADTVLSAPVSPGILAMVMSFILTPPGMYIVLGFIVLAVVSAFYSKRIKPKRRAAMDSLERQLQDFADLETLRHFMAVYLDRGTCVFYHPFVEERIQPDLISGFIAAITSVYGEIKGDGVRGTLEEIQYHGLRLNSYSGKYVIGILILEGEMTKLLRERLRFFIEVFEKHHEMYLEDWDGLVDCFDPEWVVSNLTGSFNYTGLLPHKFGKKRKVSKLDGKILDLIGTRRNNRREFNLRDLIKPVAALMGASEARALDKLLAMEDKGLIEPIGIQTVLQRQGLGLANGEDETITAPVSIPEPKPSPKAVPAKSKPAKKIEPMDIGRIAAEHEPIKPREGTGKPDPGKPRFIDETEPKDIDKSSPKLATAPTAEAKEAKAKPTEKKKAPKEELSEADKFLTEVIILLAKEKKEMDKSD